MYKLKWNINASFIWISRETVSPAIQVNIFTLIYVKLVLNEIDTQQWPVYMETSLLCFVLNIFYWIIQKDPN